ncbi:hypothetical protein G7Y89_g10344 [Cudoniella acicularis]|uniref:Rhodopsin domain-containing protein n=1 Tax=Cudoniella acicularis TaxID=354080 RepID=A0A8H4W125_9HELO|nr:hypothetical protein G7Y89_g10344 [Cudoniella acicularis]
MPKLQDAKVQDSALNHGPAINNIAWVLLVTSTLFICTRVGTKWATSKRFGIDEVLIIISLLFCLLQTVAVNVEVANGFGQPLTALSDNQIEVSQKYLYASNILFIASQTFAKLSVLFLIRQISPIRFHERLALAFGGLTIVWFLTSVLVLTFQCHLPQTWNILSNKCVNLRAAWNYINTFNVALEAGLLVLPIVVIWNIQVQTKRKVVIVGVFWSRALVIAAIIWQALRFNLPDTSFGPTFMNWLTTITITLVENLSIITACVPYLKPFLQSLESGLVRSDDLRRRGDITNFGTGFDKVSGAYGSGSRRQVSGNRSQLTTKDNESKSRETAVELAHIVNPQTVASVTVGRRNSRDRPAPTMAKPYVEMDVIQQNESSMDEAALGNLKMQSIAERDDAQLRRVGKVPVLKRKFGFMSMLGFSCTILITWEAELMTLGNLFTNGGYAGTVYAYIIAWVGILCAFVTMGELASMAPVSGGQYHWASMLAPASSGRFLSYLVGWLNVVGWQSAVAGIGFLNASLIQGISALNSSTYSPQPWQATLLVWAVVIVAVFVNTVISSLLPKIEGLVLILHVLGFFAILIPLISMGPHGDASDVFTVFVNGGAWPTMGVSFMIGMVSTVWNFLGADGAVHMSEEVHNAAVVVPWAIIFSILLNGALGFGMLLAALFRLGDPTVVFASPAPFMTIFQQAVGANGGANAMIAIIILLAFSALISITAGASRMTWSFARDRGLPGWHYLSKVDSRAIPVFAVTLTATITCLLALINIGSSAAFNDVISLTINSLFITYLIGNGLLLWRRVTGKILVEFEVDHELRNVDCNHLVWGPMHVPEPFGTIVNVIGCVFMIVVLFFSFWPAVNHPVGATMNYSSLMLGATVIFSTAYYFIIAKKTYTGPIVEI